MIQNNKKLFFIFILLQIVFIGSSLKSVSANEISRVDNSGGTSYVSNYNLSEKVIVKLDALLLKVEGEKDKRGYEKWTNYINNIINKLNAYKKKDNLSTLIVNVIDYLDVGLKKMLNDNDLDGFLCSLTGDCGEEESNNSESENKKSVTGWCESGIYDGYSIKRTEEGKGGSIIKKNSRYRTGLQKAYYSCSNLKIKIEIPSSRISIYSPNKQCSSGYIKKSNNCIKLSCSTGYTLEEDKCINYAEKDINNTVEVVPKDKTTSEELTYGVCSKTKFKCDKGSVSGGYWKVKEVVGSYKEDRYPYYEKNIYGYNYYLDNVYNDKKDADKNFGGNSDDVYWSCDGSANNLGKTICHIKDYELDEPMILNQELEDLVWRKDDKKWVSAGVRIQSEDVPIVINLNFSLKEAYICNPKNECLLLEEKKGWKYISESYTWEYNGLVANVKENLYLEGPKYRMYYKSGKYDTKKRIMDVFVISIDSDIRIAEWQEKNRCGVEKFTCKEGKGPLTSLDWVVKEWKTLYNSTENTPNSLPSWECGEQKCIIYNYRTTYKPNQPKPVCGKGKDNVFTCTSGTISDKYIDMDEFWINQGYTKYGHWKCTSASLYQISCLQGISDNDINNYPNIDKK